MFIILFKNHSINFMPLNKYIVIFDINQSVIQYKHYILPWKIKIIKRFWWSRMMER